MPSRSALAQLYLANALMACAGIFSKLIPANAITITELRCAVAVFVLALIVKLLKGQWRLSSRREFLGVLVLGLLMGAHWASYFQAMQSSTVAIGTLAIFVFPVMTVLLEPLFGGSRLHWRDLILAFVVLLGVALLVVDKLENIFNLEMNNYFSGVMWGLMSALFLSFRNLGQKYYFSQLTAAKLMLYQVVVIAFMFMPFADWSVLPSFTAEHWLWLLVLAVVVTSLGHSLFVHSFKALPAKSVSMISCVQPLLVVFIAWLVLGEQPSPQVYMGGALILAVAFFESWVHSRS